MRHAMSSDAHGEARTEPVPLRYHLPNALTAARVAALPIFWVLLWNADDGYSIAAALMFGVMAITDYLDGYLARRFNHTTRFGRIVDPIADRLLINSAVLLLWWHDRIPLVAALLIIARDLVLLAGLKEAAKRGYELSVLYLGKLATAILMVSIFLLMLTTPGSDWPLFLFYLGLALAIAAGFAYVVTARGRLARAQTS